MLEEWLLEKGFELHTWYQTNKLFRLEICDDEFFYVRIWSGSDVIVSAEYKNKSIIPYNSDKIITMSTINTKEQVEHLLKAFNYSKKYQKIK